jgi:hypothetical protein
MDNPKNNVLVTNGKELNSTINRIAAEYLNTEMEKQKEGKRKMEEN